MSTTPEAVRFIQQSTDAQPAQDFVVTNYEGVQAAAAAGRPRPTVASEFASRHATVGKRALEAAPWVATIARAARKSVPEAAAGHVSSPWLMHNVFVSSTPSSSRTYWAALQPRPAGYNDDLGVAEFRQESDDRGAVAVIEGLYVMPEAQRQGVGRALAYTALEGYAPGDTVRFVATADNEAMIKWGESLSFRRVGVQGTTEPLYGTTLPDPVERYVYETSVDAFRTAAVAALGQVRYGTYDELSSATMGA